MTSHTDAELKQQVLDDFPDNDTGEIEAIDSRNMFDNVIDSKLNLVNVSTSTSLGTSDILVPSQNAVKVYVDGASGAVDSVNGETGVVVLNQDEVLDGSTYVRTHNDLTDTLLGNISTNNAKVTFPEAPSDGNQYARKNAAWEVISGSGGAVDSVFGRTGVVTSAVGDYTKEQITGLKTTDSPQFDEIKATELSYSGNISTSTAYIKFISRSGTPSGHIRMGTDNEFTIHETDSDVEKFIFTANDGNLMITGSNGANGHKISVTASAPSSPSTGDIFIDIS